MKNPLTLKLEKFSLLSDDEKQLLDDILGTARHVRTHRDIASEGEPIDRVHLLVEGLACRYKMLDNGTKQIVSFIVPGDFCDPHVFILKSMDHSIGTLSPCTIAEIEPWRILEMTERPAIARALWWSSLVEESISREWLVNLGRRSAKQAMAHLFCELQRRMQTVQQSEPQTTLPIRQSELADALGMSTVHVNRTLQELRAEKLMTFKSGKLGISNLEGLKRVGGFDPGYLYLDERRPDLSVDQRHRNGSAVG